MNTVFYGENKISRPKVVSLLEDIVEDSTNTPVLVITPTLNEETNSSVKHAADWLLNNKKSYEVVINSEFEYSDYATKIIESSEKVHKTSNPSRIMSLGDIMYMTWDDEDFECQRVYVSAERRGVVTFDLSDDSESPQLIVMDDPEEDEDDEEFRGTPMVGGDREDLDVYIKSSNDLLVKKVQRILDKALEDIKKVLNENVESKSPRARGRR
jgi:hypothetical protein